MKDVTIEHQEGGYTLVELLITISIIALLANLILPAISKVRDKAYYARALTEFRSIENSVMQYLEDYGSYPPDADRDIPPGLEDYLASDLWPDAAWPGSVFDWDNWPDPDHPGERIYQISVRFCPIGEPDECRFPNDDWASDFDIHSAVYYCLGGPCRSHSSRPANHPGYCVNCND